jgi:hypothetical protein
MMPLPYQAFTARAKGRSLRLLTEIEIFPAFDPVTTPIPPQSRKYQALYDTGATNSAISPQVVIDLQLPSIRATNVAVGGGTLLTTSHLVNIILPNRVGFPNVFVTKMALLGGFDALIGMDIIGSGDFAVTHKNGSTTFSFCFPSLKEIDFVSELQSLQNQKSVPRTSVPKVSRNAPCPCGSGKKYKGCHGRHF